MCVSMCVGLLAKLKNFYKQIVGYGMSIHGHDINRGALDMHLMHPN